MSLSLFLNLLHANTVLRAWSKAICSLTDSKFSILTSPVALSSPRLPLPFHCPPAPFVSLNHPAVQPLINEALCPPLSFSLCVLCISVISLLIAILLLISLVIWVLCILWLPIHWIQSFTGTSRPPLEWHYEHSVSTSRPPPSSLSQPE